jgi:hypothetical protein
MEPSGEKSISPRHQWTTNLMTWTTDYCRNTTKSGHKSKYQLTAPSINCPRAWKHSGMVDRTFRRGIHFTQTPLDYKYDDLDYRLLQEHYKKAVISQNISSQHHQ